MQVILSGYNLDINTLKELKAFIQKVADRLSESEFYSLNPVAKEETVQLLHKEAVALLERDNLTPETLSAAYARISRNPKPVNELREIARQEVDKARRSNQNIIFGLGHSSVAEHAAFNFDIIGVSRFAVEAIEKFRLASYTEKSQRYILFQDDFVIPQEIKGSKIEKEYIDLIHQQNETYHQLYEKLRPYFFEKYHELAQEKKNHRRIEGLAKEDARYVISLATQTQLGMTVNARSLENMIAKCGAHSLAEVREYAKKLVESTEGFAPSIIKYVEPTTYLVQKDEQVKNFLNSHKFTFQKQLLDSESEVKLIDFPRDADNQILAAIAFRFGLQDYQESLDYARQLNPSEKETFFRKIFRNINSWDSVLREFEFADLTFQIICSASAFGQLKRHRMANIVAQEYDVKLGVTIPDSISDTGQQDIFLNIIEKTNQLYQKIYQEHPVIAPYILTNSHRRRVLFKINLREFYHFIRLREDEHAQWDIRQIARQMHELVVDKLPLSGNLLCGKDKFRNVYQKHFSE